MDLINWVMEKGLGPEDLDEIVREAASAFAANSNNEGLPSQIDFLKKAGWTDEEIKQALEADNDGLDN